MKVTAFTAHNDRPKAWALCERYLARQNRQPDQWLVIDSSPNPITPSLPCDYFHRPDLVSMPQKVLFAIENNLIKGEVITWWENDDWFRADWLAWCHNAIERGYEIVGEGHAVYYHVGHRWWSECRNVRHAALVQTAVHRDLLDNVANVIRSYGSPFFDTRIWQLNAGKFLSIPKSPAERRVVGIKGMYGAAGYSGEHAALRPPETVADPSMMQLHRWIGADAEAYLSFKRKS